MTAAPAILARTATVPAPGPTDGTATGRPPAASGVAPGLRYDVALLRTPREIEALAPEWLALEAQARGAVLFQSHGWCHYLMAVCASAPGGGLDPVVVTVRSRDGLVGLWPLRIARNAGVTVLRDLGFPFGQYADLLVAPSAEPLGVIDAALHALRRSGVADGLILDKVRDDAALAAISRLGAFAMGEALAAPSIKLSTFATLEDYRRHLSTKMRKTLRNTHNRLERAGEVRHIRADGTERQAALLDEAFSLRLGWLDEKGLSSTAFRDPAFPRVVAGLSSPKAAGLEVWTLALEVEGRSAAVQCGFVHNGRYYAYLTGRDPAQDQLSPGKVHLSMVIEECHRRGIETADLLAPAAPYKLSFAKDLTPVRDLAIGWTLKGRLALDLWQRRLRPAAKAAFLRLPLSVRRSVAGTVNRTETD